jgi:hypothetical protein
MRREILSKKKGIKMKVEQVQKKSSLDQNAWDTNFGG